MTDWIAEAQQRVDDATTGPWQVCPTPSEGAHGHAVTAEGVTEEPIVAVDWGCPVIEDATFIAAARTDLPKALNALRAVQDLADAYEKYAAVCERDAQTGSSDSPIRKHWASEAAQARLFARRVRAAISA